MENSFHDGQLYIDKSCFPFFKIAIAIGTGTCILSFLVEFHNP